MSVQFHDPRAEPMAPVEPYALASKLERGVAVGLLANGFPDSANFLVEVGEALAKRLPGATFHSYDKGDASNLASPELLGEITDRCDVVVAAYGH